MSAHSPERYLLREMSPVEQEEFERHYFECEECALAVEAGEVFIANTRAVLVDSESEAKKKVESGERRRSFWNPLRLWWTEPAFAFAAAAILILGALSLYQGLVQLPRLRHNLDDARVLPAFQLMASSRGEPAQVTVAPGTRSFSVSADIPPDVHFSRYVCSLSSGGRILFSLPSGAPALGQPITILVPTKDLSPGTYELTIYGVDADGRKSERISTFPFALEFR
jgi:hypothetical protein